MRHDGYQENDKDYEREDDFEDGCGETYTIDGICPCCGSDNTITKGGNYDDDPQQEVCIDCGWRGSIEY